MLNSLILELLRILQPQPETMPSSGAHTGVCLEVLVFLRIAQPTRSGP